MTDGIAQRYASVIRSQMTFFATWPVEGAVTVGDYGPLNGALFQRFNNLGTLPSTTSPGQAGYDFAFGASRAINTSAEARAKYGIAEGKALVDVSFSSESAVMFSTPDETIIAVNDIEALGRQLTTRYDNGNWNLDHGVVVEVHKVSTATILLSEKSGASASLSLEGSVPTAAAVASAKTSLVAQDGVGVKIVGQGPLTPLFRLAFLKTRWFQDPQIVIRSFTGNITESAQEQHKIAEERYLQVY